MGKRYEDLESYIFRRIAIIIGVLGMAMLVFIIPVSAIIAYRMTGKVSSAVEELVRSNVIAYLQALDGYERVIEDRLKPALEEIPKLYYKNRIVMTLDIQNLNVALSGERALGYGIYVFDMNGRILFETSPVGMKIDGYTLEVLKKLKPGEIIFERVEDVVDYYGKKAFVKNGYVKISSDKAAVIRVYVSWSDMDSFVSSISEIPNEYDFVENIGVYKYNLKPFGDWFKPLSGTALKLAKRAVETGSQVQFRKLTRSVFADPIDLPARPGTFSKPLVMVLTTNFMTFRNALWINTVVFLTIVVVSMRILHFEMKDFAKRINKTLHSLLDAVNDFREKKVLLDTKEIEDSGIKEFRELLIHFYEMAQDITAYVEMLESSEQELEKAYQEVEKAYSELEESHLLFAQELSMIAEGYDEITGNHIYRVGELSAFIAEKLELGETFVNEIRYYARLHDIGKLLVPHEILNKPGKLTEEEFEVMKKHTLYGEVLLGDLKRFEMAKNIALYHHEKYSGKGYPFGLKGEEIPIEARTVAVVDVYDVLRSKRPYKEGMEHERAMKIILEGDGRTSPEDFDPDILEILRKYCSQIEELWNAVNTIETSLDKKLRDISNIMKK